MKLYRINTYHDDVEGVSHWARTLNEARKIIQALKARQQEDGDCFCLSDLKDPELIEKVTVPKNKSGLLQFLRVNAKSEGDTNIGSVLVYDDLITMKTKSQTLENQPQTKDKEMGTQEIIKNALSYVSEQAEKHPKSYGWGELAECFADKEDMKYFLGLHEAKKSWDQVVATLNEHARVRSELAGDVKATCW